VRHFRQPHGRTANDQEEFSVLRQLIGSLAP
jgi:hypothetical protein